MSKLIMAGLVAVLALPLAVAPAVAAPRPIVLEFDKQWQAPGYYVGTLTGGGTIEMWVSNSRIHGATQHFHVTVAAQTPDGAFVADLDGIFTFSTAEVVLNGTVTSGWMAGARVHEESKLVDPELGRFVGTIRILPSSS